MKRLLVILTGIVLVFMAVASPRFAKASEATVPFKVSCVVHPEIVGGGPGYIIAAVPADCVGTHLGNSEWFSQLTAFMDPDDPFGTPAPQYGDMVFTAANGAMLYGHFEGENLLRMEGGFDYWGTYEIYGGTGRFGGTTGSGVYYGGATVSGPLTFEGELINP